MPPPDDLDVVQHPTLGPLKFPKSMPFDQRNAIIADMVKSAPPPSQPGDANYANQQARAALASKVTPVDMPLSGAERWWNKPSPNWSPEAQMAMDGGADESKAMPYSNSPRDAFHKGSQIIMAESAPATASAFAAAPVATGLGLASGYIGGKVGGAGGKFVGNKLGAPTLGEDVGSTIGSVVSGTVGAKSASPLQRIAADNPNVAAQAALKPTARGAESLQESLPNARAYLQGSKNLADLNTRTVPAAKAEIWKPYSDAMDSIGHEPVVGPDGQPTTYGQLEARRVEVSAQRQGVLSKDPVAVQTAIQKGQTAESLGAEDAAIKSILDPRLRQMGVNPEAVRNTFGDVQQVARLASGRNTLTEEPQRYGLGRMSQDLSINPVKTVKGVATGARDILAGKPLWSGKPTDVAIDQAFHEGGPKPSMETTTSPAPIGPEYRPPFVQPPPAEQVPATGPGSTPATFPEINPNLWTGGTAGGAPPIGKLWGPEPTPHGTAPATYPNSPTHPDVPPTMPPTDSGLAPAPSTPVSSPPGAPAPSAAPSAPAATSAAPPATASAPPTMPPPPPESPVPVEDEMEAARRGAPGINPTIRSLARNRARLSRIGNNQ